MESYRAHSLFQPSNLGKAVASTLDDSGNCISHLYGSIMSLPHTVTARTVAVLGFDFIMVDALHTAFDAENLIQIIQTINFTSEGKTIAIARVPSLSSDLLTHALDAGAAGIVFPHINSPEEAARAVSKCRYACSGGARSISPSALITGITDLAPGSSHAHVADKHIIVICQIETSLGLENVEAIAAMPGVDALMIGTIDLRLSLGLPIRRLGESDEPIFTDAIHKIIQAAKKNKKPLMAVAFNVSVERDSWIKNFSMLYTSADILSVVKGHKEDLMKLRKIMGTGSNKS